MSEGTKLIVSTLVVTGLLQAVCAFLLFWIPNWFPFGESGALFLGIFFVVLALASIGGAVWFRVKVVY